MPSTNVTHPPVTQPENFKTVQSKNLVFKRQPKFEIDRKFEDPLEHINVEAEENGDVNAEVS